MFQPIQELLNTNEAQVLEALGIKFVAVMIFFFYTQQPRTSRNKELAAGIFFAALNVQDFSSQKPRKLQDSDQEHM